MQPDLNLPLAEPGLLAALAQGQRNADPVEGTFQVLDKALALSPGHRLLTVLVYFEDRGESQRAYSSRPIEYPRGGRKTLGQAPRMRKVLADGRPYVGRTRHDIIDNFPDHPLLLSMGCECIVNMPVHWGDRVLGTVNLLDAEGKLGERDLPQISAWAQLSAPAFLALLHGIEPFGPAPPR